MALLSQLFFPVGLFITFCCVTRRFTFWKPLCFININHSFWKSRFVVVVFFFFNLFVSHFPMLKRRCLFSKPSSSLIILKSVCFLLLFFLCVL